LPQLKLLDTEQYYDQKVLLKLDTEEFNSNNTDILNHQEIEDLLNRDNWFFGHKHDDAVDYLKSLDKAVLRKFFETEGWSN
jgi:hypothetical protein